MKSASTTVALFVTSIVSLLAPPVTVSADVKFASRNLTKLVPVPVLMLSAPEPAVIVSAPLPALTARPAVVPLMLIVDAAVLAVAVIVRTPAVCAIVPSKVTLWAPVPESSSVSTEVTCVKSASTTVALSVTWIVSLLAPPVTVSADVKFASRNLTKLTPVPVLMLSAPEPAVIVSAPLPALTARPTVVPLMLIVDAAVLAVAVIVRTPAVCAIVPSKVTLWAPVPESSKVSTNVTCVKSASTTVALSVTWIVSLSVPPATVSVDVKFADRNLIMSAPAPVLILSAPEPAVTVSAPAFVLTANPAVVPLMSIVDALPAVAVTVRMPAASDSVASVTFCAPVPGSSKVSTDVTFVKLASTTVELAVI